MFNMHGLGPKDGSASQICAVFDEADSPADDFIGGDLQWAAGLSLITPIPKREEWPLKGHFFLNAGRLVGQQKSKSAIVSCLNIV
jgi:outer membrane protein insertion porin family